MKNLLILIFTFLLNVAVFSQPTGVWKFGLPGDVDEAMSVIQCKDKGFAIVGSTRTYSIGLSDITVTRLDSNMNVIWNRTLGGPNNDSGIGIVQTSDSGFVVAGNSNSFSKYQGSDYDIYVVKLDISGNTQWSRSFSHDTINNMFESCKSINLALDGNVLIGGNFGVVISTTYISGIETYKISPAGLVLWSGKIFGSSTTSSGLNSLVPTNDGGFAIAGSSSSVYEIFHMKLSNTNIKQWGYDHVAYISSFPYYNYKASEMIQTSDSSYVLTGSVASPVGQSSVVIAKYDKLGVAQWIKHSSLTVPSTLINSSYGSSIIQTADGGYAVTGWALDMNFNHILLLKYNSNGTLLWSKLFGNNFDQQYGYKILQTKDKGFLIVGSEATSTSHQDFYIIKTDSNGITCAPTRTLAVTQFTLNPKVTTTGTFTNQTLLNFTGVQTTTLGIFTNACSTISNKSENEICVECYNKFNLYPVPSNKELYIKTEVTGGELRIYNSLGEVLLQLEIIDKKTFLDLEKYQPGLYFAEYITRDRNRYTQKIIRE